MSDYIYTVLSIIGGIILIVGSIQKMPYAHKWARIALGYSGVCGVIWAILKIIQIYYLFPYNTVEGLAIQTLKNFISGMAAGLIILVFIAGGFKYDKFKAQNKEQ